MKSALHDLIPAMILMAIGAYVLVALIQEVAP